MQVVIDKFIGERPLFDSRLPSKGLAIRATNCYFRRQSLNALPAPEPTGITVRSGTRKLFRDPRTGIFYGGELSAGMIPESFRDDEMIYVFDGDVHYATDKYGNIAKIYPIDPSHSGQGNPLFFLTESAPAITTDGNIYGESISQADLNNTSGMPRSRFYDLLADAANTPETEGSYDVTAVALLFKKVARHALWNFGSSKLLTAPLATGWQYAVDVDWSHGPRTPNEWAHLVSTDLMFSSSPRSPQLSPGIREAHTSLGTATTYPFAKHSDETNPNATWRASGSIGLEWGRYVLSLLYSGSDNYTPASSLPLITNDTDYDFMYGPVINSAVEPSTPPFLSGFPGRAENQVPGSLIVRLGEQMAAYFYDEYRADIVRGIAPRDTGLDHDSIIAWVYSVAASYYRRTPTWINSEGNTAIVPFQPGSTSLALESKDHLTRPVPVAFCYTWVDKYGRESRPSFPITKLSLTEQHETGTYKMTVTEIPPPDTYYLNIYRATGDVNGRPDETEGSTFLLCKQVAIVPEMSLANIQLPPLYESLAFDLTTHEHMYAERDAKLHRFVDSGYTIWAQRGGNEVCVSFKHIPYATHFGRMVQLPAGTTVLGIEVVNMVIYLITNENHYILHIGEDQGLIGVNITLRLLELAPPGCLNPNSIVNTGWGVAYFATVGLVLLQGNEVLLPLSTMMGADQAAEWCPTLAAAYWDGYYVGFNAFDGVCIELLDPRYANGREPSMSRLSFGADAATTSNDGYLYYLPVGGTELYRMFMASPSRLAYDYETFDAVYPTAQTWSALMAAGEGDDITIDVIVDDRTILSRTVALHKMVRLPRHNAAYRLRLRVRGTASINYIVVSTTGVENAYAQS